ncbi:MAG TPA: ABC transporter permease [Puia sp.]|jgi:ABC-type antimicrobial peptide transport system permease subunit|nr:ABC transporter permease [Puia sp.]
MIKSYFLIAWRGLVKNRVYSAINLSGLAIGLAVVLLIAFWVRDELGFNKNFATYDHAVRVMVTTTRMEGKQTDASVPIPLSVALRTDFGADFKTVSMTSWNSDRVLTVGDKVLSIAGLYAEPGMMDILDLHANDGRKAVLEDPSSMLINESTAIALFGTKDVVGKTVKLDNRKDFRIAGVFADFPYSSTFRETQYFLPWADYATAEDWVRYSTTNWTNNAFQMFALLNDKADLFKAQAEVAGVLYPHRPKLKPVVELFPMARWHLYNTWFNGKNVGGTVQLVWMFGTIGVFVLLLACINFMNLSTARSEKRAKEVGIRKSVGSQRWQLVGQFLGESVFLAMIAFAGSLLLVELALPWMNGVADKQMHIPWDKPVFWLLALGGAVLAGLIAGSYPAFYLSSFNPVKVLKGTFRAGRWASVPRQALIVVQFTVSVVLIIGTIIVFQQISYAKNRPVGYDRNGLISVDILSNEMRTHFEAIRQDLEKSGAVSRVAESNSPTTQVYTNQSSFDWAGKDESQVTSFAVVFNSMDFGRTVGWRVVAGRDFSADFASDSTAMILNETAVRYIGLKQPVGAIIRYGQSTAQMRDYHVIGVVRDIVMNDPFYPVKQTVWMLDNNEMSNVLDVKLNPSMPVSKAVPMVGSIVHKYVPAAPFQYSFNDLVYAQKFELEDRIGKLAGFFTIFAIFISCLGLFGLASFVAEQRVKEIGVRKVLGASVATLWGLLSRDFVVLVGISFLFAAPLAYKVMHGWLLQYNYRVAISVWVFVAAMGVAMLITLLTVSWQALRAARANPVDSLKIE